MKNFKTYLLNCIKGKLISEEVFFISPLVQIGDGKTAFDSGTFTIFLRPSRIFKSIVTQEGYLFSQLPTQTYSISKIGKNISNILPDNLGARFTCQSQPSFLEGVVLYLPP